ncbi:uncharacterized protein [Antedon mediterranea]|uniref:uncharacterized protein n=1 Tax=Antedon mediterranea TaxID=105859 RepID=UPI003AF58D83
MDYGRPAVGEGQQYNSMFSENATSHVAMELQSMGGQENQNQNPWSINNRIHSMRKETDVHPEDSISQTGSRVSRVSAASSNRVKESANLAGLLAKQEALKRKRELQQKALALQLEMEELALKTQIEISSARERIYTEAEIAEIKELENECGIGETNVNTDGYEQPDNEQLQNVPVMLPQVSNNNNNHQGNIPDERIYTHDIVNGPPEFQHPVGTNPYAPTYAPIYAPTYDPLPHQALYEIINQMTASQQTQQQLTQLIVDQQQRNLLPPTNIPKFKGNLVEFRSFVKAFESRVSTRTQRTSEKLHYLEQYTMGDANSLVRSCMHLDAETGYKEAWRLLKEKYGNEYKITQEYIEQLTNWNIIKPDDVEGLEKFSIYLTTCKNAMDDLKSMREMEHPKNLQTIVRKLPYYIQDRWSRKSLEIRDKHNQITFANLVNFITQEVRVATDPVFGRQTKRDKVKPETKPDRKHTQSFAVDVKETAGRRPISAHCNPCLFCKGDHTMEFCRALQKKTHSEKIAFLMSMGLCFKCLIPGHRSSDCKRKIVCETCNKEHATILHREENPQTTQSISEKDASVAHEPNSTQTGQQPNRVANGAIGAGSNLRSCMAIIPVLVRANTSGKTIKTYAFLDNGSSATFCTESLMEQLSAEKRQTRLILSTINHRDQPVNSHIVSSLEVSNLVGGTPIKLPRLYTVKEIPVTKEEIPLQKDIRTWPYLQDLKIPELDAEIGLLIGNDVPKAMEPWEVINSQGDGPYATKTRLGWAINGPIRRSELTNDERVNRIAVKSNLEEQFQIYANQDFNERSYGEKLSHSREDKEFMRKVDGSASLIDGHYQIGLPLKDHVLMPNNRAQAQQRASQLKRKFDKSQTFYEDYKRFITKVIEAGYAERVKDNIIRNDGMVWYLPHHGIYHPNKPGKIRVVFDCAARYHGTSLNDQLLQGPDLTNSLVGVLLRFREEQVAITGDIESMFHQVRVPNEHRDLLRFLWWTNGDLTKEPEEYRMAVHLFGAKSSPSCANYALLKTAKDNMVDAEVAESVEKNFYVDDYLKSVATEEKAIAMIKEVRSLCAQGGFNITKWSSNRRNVISSIPETDRAKELSGLDLDRDALPIERVLGVHWMIDTDSFSFKVAAREKPVSRRGILSSVSSVYDPLGFAAPFVLPAKNLLQDLCRLNLGWDEEIPTSIRDRWSVWKSDLAKLEKLSVYRCYKPTNFGMVKHSQIHHFADASEGGYGSVAYLRSVNQSGDIHCSFLMGKARVTPLKNVTIPRLELNAATVAVRLDALLKEELQIEVEPSVFWTDSTAVLGYINNTTARYQTFVANRLATIHERSVPSQWKYVPTDLNPADDASRGQTAEEFLNSKRWINGPDFLWTIEENWPKDRVLLELKDNDPEVKTPILANVILTKEAEGTINQLINTFSDWTKLTKAVAWLLRCKRVLHAKIKNETARAVLEPLDLAEIEEAEKEVLIFVQRSAFKEEIEHLNTNATKPIKRKSPITKLDPKLSDGLLRVGGRLCRASMPEESKQPIILPNKSHVSEIIIRHLHAVVGHSGRNHVISKLRQKYWVINANSAVRKIISKCVICRKLRGKTCEQKMADLPVDRITPDEPPFTRVGTDYFGPFEVKRGRSLEKRYGVIFTCLATRAIHIEVAHSMDTDSCINALRRFVARRGQVKQIRSDNGTNFVGANKCLKEAIAEWNQNKIHNAMLQRCINWSFNAPGASHHGGIWERLIRSIRNILSSLLKEQNINDECLHTYLCEVEAIINSRPLTSVSGEHNDLEPLTPNHLLLLNKKTSLPPGIFEKNDIYARRRWKQAQYMADVFWRRWLKEYLPALQERQKWMRSKRNVEPGDVVLVVDNAAPRNVWLLGKITKVKPDSNGVVRIVEVQTKNSVLERPISKLVILLENDN